MKEARAVIMLLSLSVAVTFAQAPSPPKLPHVSSEVRIPLPKEGLVPDKETAIKLAEVILFRLYGEKNITAQKPYAVTEDQNIWWICGAPPPALGSSFEIAISRQTGAILHLQHWCNTPLVITRASNHAMERTADRPRGHILNDFQTPIASDARPRPPSLILFSLDLYA